MTTKNLRAAGYCRTSGEGQRDNTSIPTQIEGTEAFIDRNGWALHKVYVDECKSGAKIDGREAFQQLMADAAAGKFDVFVPYNTTRAGRDGVDILTSAKTLKNVFGIITVGADGQYDNRDHRKALTNYVSVGVSEHERLTTMERTIGGRIRRAKEGLPWAGERPCGRSFERTGKNAGRWHVNETGEKLRALLERYADGEPMGALVDEYGFSGRDYVHNAVNRGRLSGTYVVTFNAPDIGIENLEVPVPAIPEVISVELHERVRARLLHNRTWNKPRRPYPLTGFAHCAKCGRPLTGQRNHGRIYYRHPSPHCGWPSIHGGELEAGALDYLYGQFLDAPAFDAAVTAAMPTDDDRKALERDHGRVKRAVGKVEREIARLVDAIAAGADVGLLLDKQDKLKAERKALTERLEQLERDVAAMPDPTAVAQRAAFLRVLMLDAYQCRDWRELPFEEIRTFLHYLFGDNPRAAGHGVFVDKQDGRWVLTFKGRAAFHHDVVAGRKISKAVQVAAAAYNEQIARIRSVKPSETNRFVPTPGFDSLSNSAAGGAAVGSERSRGNTPQASASS